MYLCLYMHDQTCNLVGSDRTDPIFEQPRSSDIMKLTSNNSKDADASKVQEQNPVQEAVRRMFMYNLVY